MNLKCYIFVLSICAFTFEASAKAWDRNNSPSKIDSSFEKTFEGLPLSVNLRNQGNGWPANHWDNINGGISFRWTSHNPQNFKYKSPSKSKLLTSSTQFISELSPAEKFDILTNKLSYPLVKKVRSQTSPNEAFWNGICHGVAPASIYYKEPINQKIMTPSGVEVEFHTSDVKALISYYYAKVSNRSRAKLMGKRCNSRKGTRSARKRRSCQGVNAGAFHIALTNTLGLKRKNLLVDIDRYLEVWNHVAVDYNSYIVDQVELKPTSSKKATLALRIQTSVGYASAIQRHLYPILSTPEAYYLDHSYDYIIEIDSKGEIVGGEWISELRPDFIWTRKAEKLRGRWKILETSGLIEKANL